ncbi:hypothetical protein QFC22_000371 [Naganishia vaughanmartiniae]|uniref:Uncharacterized protein n=1 Tax=Naganishia vaughanmartiniae TaxID=1424756 RepID=A0ACC2XQY4_9TREE|nr:hypothetical protein QFC22_000371 [Naganishia vaughanmartiniae]
MASGTDEDTDQNGQQIQHVSRDDEYQKHQFTPSPSVSPPPTSTSVHYPAIQQTPTRGTTLASSSPMLAGLGISGVMTGRLEEERALPDGDLPEGSDAVEKQERSRALGVPESGSGTPLTIKGVSRSSSSTQTPTNTSSSASPFTVSRKSMNFGRADEHERIHRVREHEHNTFKKNSPPSPTDRSGIGMERFEGPSLSPEVSQKRSTVSTGALPTSQGFLDPFDHAQTGLGLSSPFDPSSAQLLKQDGLPSRLYGRTNNSHVGSAYSSSSSQAGRSFETTPPPLSPSLSESSSRANSGMSHGSNRQHGDRSSSTFPYTRTPPTEKKSRPRVAESGIDTGDFSGLIGFEDSTSPVRRWRNKAASLEDEAEEGRNSLPDLPLVPSTPNRMSFNFAQQQHSRYSPVPQSTAQMRSSLGAMHSGRHLSATRSDFIVPPTPTITPSWQHGRSDSVASNWSEGDHRVHARNLSLFFPRPDADGVVPPPQRSPSMVVEEDREAPVTLILPKGESSKPHSANGFSFGLPPPPRSPSMSVGVTGGVDIPGQHTTFDVSKKRHSAVTYSAVASPNQVSTSILGSPPHSAKPKTVASTLLNGTQAAQELEVSSIPLLPSPFQVEKQRSLLARMLGLSPQTQLRAGLGTLELFLGVSLWVDGQLHGNVSMTGLGYMLVFDAMGLFLQVWGGRLTNGVAAQSTIANPFGAYRRESLYYFVQAIFLLFAATYIAKESLEHMLMTGEHGSETQHHGHASHREHGAILLHGAAVNAAHGHRPHNSISMLLIASVSSIISGAVLQNHAKLVEAVGPLLLTSSKGVALVTNAYKLHPMLGRCFERYLDNPFSSAVSACCIAAMLVQAFVPVGQVDLAEKALALAETILAFWLAYPASVAFGKVLLQTAPPQDALQVLAIKKAIREIEAHPAVTRVSRPHIWQLTPCNPRNTMLPVAPSRPKPISRATSHYNRTERSETHQRRHSNAAGSSILVANIAVHLRADLEARKVTEVTRLAYDAIDNAIGTRKSKDKWATGGGELSVMVMRGERKQRNTHVHHSHDHDSHDHHHHHEHNGESDHAHQDAELEHHHDSHPLSGRTGGTHSHPKCSNHSGDDEHKHDHS